MKHLFLVLMLLFVSAKSDSQAVQTATFKDTKSLFAKEGKAYSVRFQLSLFPSEEVVKLASDYANSNRISLKVSPSKSEGAQVIILFPEDLANGPVLGKLLFQLSVVDIIIKSEGGSSMSIDEFIQKL